MVRRYGKYAISGIFFSLVLLQVSILSLQVLNVNAVRVYPKSKLFSSREVMKRARQKEKEN